MRVRRTAAVAAALAAAGGCSGADQGRVDGSPRDAGTTVAATTTTEPVEAAPSLEALLVPETLANPRHRYATLAELRWAGAWKDWRERVERAADRLTVIFDGRTPDPVAPRGFVELLGRCSEDVAALGPLPNTRLRDVVRATAEACQRYEIAAAKLEQSGGEGGLPSEALFAFRHLEDADRSLSRVVPGLDGHTDPLLDRPARRSRIQIRYSAVASSIEGEQVTVHCFGPADWRRELGDRGRRPGRIAGFVQAHSASGNLAPSVCRRLDQLTYGKRPPRERGARVFLAHAVATLGHEAQHAVGRRQEGIAECYGMQRIRSLARALGARPDYATGLAELYWEYVYPSLPPRYRHDQCGPGEKLDLRPRSPVWP